MQSAATERMFPLEEQDRAIELQRMKRLATGLLILAAAIFVVALRLERQFPLAGFVRAAAEGAMVGALADWFAVTALFRHPLGLRIPHTAIIPSRKDSIGASIGRFVQNNFLTADIIAARLRAANVARRLGHWLSQPEASARVASLLSTGVAGALRVVNDADIQAMIERSVVGRVERTPAAPLLGRILGGVLVGQRRRDLLFAIVQLAAQLLTENRDAIRARIHQGAPWWMPRSVDRTIYERLVETVATTLVELSQDPEHPLHKQFDTVVQRFVERLQHDPELIAKGELYKEEIIHHPMMLSISASLWQDIKARLLEQSTRDGSALRQAIERGVVHFGALLESDEQLAEKVNHWAEMAALYGIREYGGEVSALIAHTVSRWDGESTARRIELQVGRDLQFIRINGTLVGGLAGLAIYAVSGLLR